LTALLFRLTVPSGSELRMTSENMLLVIVMCALRLDNPRKFRTSSLERNSGYSFVTVKHQWLPFI
jgi:hypothetical protein